MPKTKNIIKVVKVPLDNSLKIDKPAIFPPVTELYLQYFENKDKLRVDYLNKGYKENKPKKNRKKRNDTVHRSVLLDQQHVPKKSLLNEPKPLNELKNEPNPPAVGLKETRINSELTRMVTHTEEGWGAEDYNDDPSGDDDDDDDMVDIGALRKRLNGSPAYSDIGDDDEDKHVTDLKQKFDDMSDSDTDVSDSDDRSVVSEISDASLDASFTSGGVGRKKKSKYATPRDSRGYVSHDPDATQKLKKRLEASSYQSMKEEEEKRELLFKFDLLHKSYPESDVRQNFTIKSDIETIKHAYEMNVRRLSLDSQVESYKSYMIGGFMATEYALGHFMKFDMQGFTQQQLLQMNSYEKLLIEMGEKSYVPEGVSKFPVEVRLLFLILMNAAIFIASKMIMKKTGANLLNMVNSMRGAGQGMMPQKTQPQSQSQPSLFTRRKMKGPAINVNDL
jgi:hypothetical protein